MIESRETRRIGGEFEFTLETYAESPRARLLECPCLWTDLGRSALLVAAANIRQRGGKPRVWLPAFSCESISQPFGQLGFEFRYYPVGSQLMGDQADVPQPEAGDTLLFIHYFGHRNHWMAKAAREWRARGVWIIEDCVHASLTPKLGEHSDFAVTSCRKVLPVVDGAGLLTRLPVDFAGTGIELLPPDESFVSARMIAKILRGAHAPATEFLPLLERTEGSLGRRIVPRQMSWLSSWMLQRLNLDSIVAQRRANWLALMRGIEVADLADDVRPIFRSLEIDCAPLGVPVRVSGGQRNSLRNFLAERRIYCPVHWVLGHLPQQDVYAEERALEECILTLPVDQRMTAQHVELLIMELTAFFRSAKAGL